MIIHEHITIEPTWWIAYGTEPKVHYDFAPVSTVITTGQPHLELFYNDVDWETRLTELGVVPDPPDDEAL